jgi:two-component sensor histidine kinase
MYLSEKERAEAALIEGKMHLEEKNSQINKQNLIIEESLHQKEVLLKEIHHRVKNNLQLVSGLMQLQGNQSKDEKIKAIMDEGQNRIRSMSLIHQQLYESENLDKINFKEYVKVLIQDISIMLQSEINNISIDLDAPDFHLNIDTAVPLGLILNELIMNAFKHAFSENDSGQIRIEVLQNEKEFELKVIDNGKGLPEGFNMNSSNSLGVKLVKGLSRQIGGSCTFNSHNGTTATIKFKLD